LSFLLNSFHPICLAENALIYLIMSTFRSLSCKGLCLFDMTNCTKYLHLETRNTLRQNLLLLFP
jgi:hypothetical protein